MPIENERKFVLDEDGRLESRLAQAPGVTRSRLNQAYLDSPGVRIRSIEANGKLRHIFSFKRPVDGQMVEIETEIVSTEAIFMPPRPWRAPRRAVARRGPDRPAAWR